MRNTVPPTKRPPTQNKYVSVALKAGIFASIRHIAAINGCKCAPEIQAVLPYIGASQPYNTERIQKRRQHIPKWEQCSRKRRQRLTWMETPPPCPTARVAAFLVAPYPTSVPRVA
eukprot:3933161-Rhodomonas_salina.1